MAKKQAVTIEWIPLARALPDIGARVLGSHPEWGVKVCVVYYDGNKWRCADGAFCTLTPLAWAEFPAGYEPETAGATSATLCRDAATR